MKSWSFLAPRAKLPQQALDELRSIMENYYLLRPASSIGSSSDTEIAKLEDKLRNAPAQLWWSDLALAELCVASILTGDQIRATLPSWRRRFQDVVGSSRYAQYIATAVDISQTQNVEVLRADLMSCIKAVYYFYGSYGVAALSRTRATERLLQAAAVILAVEAAVLVIAWLSPGIGGTLRMLASLVIATSAAAVVGSVISVQRRLQDPAVEVDPFYRFIQTDADWFSTAVISPLFGAFFGLLAYGLLVSGLLSSSLLKFITLLPEVPADPLASALPSTVAGGVSIVIIGFISGFAEQLIPDALTRIAARALASVAGSDAVPAPAARPLVGSADDAAKSAQPAK